MQDREKKDNNLVHSQADLASPRGLDVGSTSAIGKRLKAYYDDVAGEPVPDRFLMLLDALDAAETTTRRTDRD